MAKANSYEEPLMKSNKYQEIASVDYIKNHVDKIKESLNSLPEDYSNLTPWEIDESVATLELIIDKLFLLITDLRNFESIQT